MPQQSTEDLRSFIRATKDIILPRRPSLPVTMLMEAPPGAGEAAARHQPELVSYLSSTLLGVDAVLQRSVATRPRAPRLVVDATLLVV